MEGKFLAEKVATLPAWEASDEGRIVYAEDVDKLYVGSGSAWVDLALADLVDDTTPQLGGDLDLNTYSLIVSGADITSTEMGYLNGVTSNIQTQLGNIDTDLLNDTTPQLGGDLDYNGFDIVDQNGNELLSFTPSGSAVNEITIANASTGYAPDIRATGDDPDIDIDMIPKGTGVLTVSGTVDYENNIIDDDDIPNKKWIDENAGGGLRWSLVTSNTTASTDHGYLVNATSGNVTITLPASGAVTVGDNVGVCDAYNMATTNSITVSGNGSPIEGTLENLTIDIDGSGFEMVYVDTTRGWEIVSEIGNNSQRGRILDHVSVNDINRTNTSLSTDQTVGFSLLTADRTYQISSEDILQEGRVFTVKDESGQASTFNIIISTEGSETIDGNDTYIISTNYGAVNLYSNGSNLFVY